jgi:hypothetical protein
MDGELQLAIEGRLQLLLDGVLAELRNADGADSVYWEMMGEAQAYRKAIRQVQVAFREAGE